MNWAIEDANSALTMVAIERVQLLETVHA